MSTSLFTSTQSLRALTAQLLIAGGDERLLLDAQGTNKYGCTPTPNEALLSFSSSTASTVSAENFSSLEQFVARLQNTLKKTEATELFEDEVARQKSEWLSLLACPQGTQLVFSPSGTDIHTLFAAQLPTRALVIMIEGCETGSGVVQALTRASNDVEIVALTLRAFNTQPLTKEEIDAQASVYVNEAIARGQHAALILVDQSKTGMIAPSPACVLTLKARYGDKLSVFVDACQFRLSAKTLTAYLEKGFIVAATGSKFLSAPSFSGMVFLPPKMPFHLVPAAVNWGLLARMEVALMQYRAFSALSNEKTAAIISDFSQVISHYIAHSPTFSALPTPALTREGLGVDANTWDTMPTLFPFILYKNQRPLSRAQTRVCYQQLPLQALPCQIGQPVACGEIEGIEVSALRFCLSTNIITQATQSTYHHNQLIYNMLRVFASIENIVASALIE